MKKTKILATFGPSIDSLPKIRSLIRSGVSAFRINCSHGTRVDFAHGVKLIRQASQGGDYPVGIVFDISGLKLRLSRFDGSVPIRRGEILTLTSGLGRISDRIIGVNHPAIIKSVKKGERVFIDDGALMFSIVSASSNSLKIKAINSGMLLPGKGINLPDSTITVPTITQKDRLDIAAAVELGADFIALSFVQSADDVLTVRRMLERMRAPVRIISKLEKREAIADLEGILMASDGVMIARGDLGVELPPADLPRIQKQIISLANKHQKLVIVATQMLESMRFNPRATRAEINDVASAVFDFADVVMLSAETASGKYPREAVQTMSDVIHATEDKHNLHPPISEMHDLSAETSQAIAQAIVSNDTRFPIRVICCFTSSGRTAELIASYFPSEPIIALTPNRKVWSQLSLYRSVYPIHIDQPKSFEEMISIVNRVVKQRRLAKRGELVIITGGTPFGSTAPTNFLKYHQIV